VIAPRISAPALEAVEQPSTLDAQDNEILQRLTAGESPQMVAIALDLELSDIVRVAAAARGPA
jgi:hypothetical protein